MARVRVLRGEGAEPARCWEVWMSARIDYKTEKASMNLGKGGKG
jgi:hypothetical protein